jgi:putative NADH-flavin reductase
MTVTIFGATGMVGKQLIIHALAKGWTVRAFGRHIEELIESEQYREHFKAFKGYVFDAGDVKKSLKGCDAVLSALGGLLDGSDRTRSLGMKNIVTQMEKNGPARIVALGGLGVMDAPDGSGPLFMQEDYPREYFPVGKEHFEAYNYLKNSSLEWTFVCSPNILEADANGKFEVTPETPASSMEINAGNIALAMVEAVEHKSYITQRIGISNTE